MTTELTDPFISGGLAVAAATADAIAETALAAAMIVPRVVPRNGVAAPPVPIMTIAIAAATATTAAIVPMVFATLLISAP